MCAECNARSFCLWCYSGKAAGDVYSTEWRAAICMLVCLLMVCSWKDGRNQEVLLSSRACCLFFLLSPSSCAISASVKNIFGRVRLLPLLPGRQQSDMQAKEKKGGDDDRGSFARGGVLQEVSFDYSKERWQYPCRANRRGEVEVVEIDSFPLSTSRLTSLVFCCLEIVKAPFIAIEAQAYSRIGSTQLHIQQLQFDYCRFSFLVFHFVTTIIYNLYKHNWVFQSSW